MEATVKCKYCEKPIHIIIYEGTKEWIHENDMFGCATQTEGMWQYADSDEPKPNDTGPYSDYLTLKDVDKALSNDMPTQAVLSNLATTFYSEKLIENLKANMPFGKVGYKVTLTSSPKAVEPSVPPKKALPKVVDIPNGRKFRDEE